MDKDKILQNLNLFFPQDGYQPENVEKGLDEGSIVVDESLIANVLKGALLDESIVEV